MSWTRGLVALLAVCVLLVTGSVSCGTHGAQEHKDGRSVSPVGKVLDDTDHEGRHYREVDKGNAPDVGIEVQPDTDDSWSVRLTVDNFTFSAAATKAKAVSGRGVAVLFVDDRPVTTLRTPSCRLPSAYVPQGTHKVTARLYADDGTVWAVDGAPVESTADVTASEPESAGGAGSGSRSMGDGEASDAGSVAGVDDALGAQPIAGAGDGTAGSQVGTGAGGRVWEPPLATGIRAASDAQAVADTAGGTLDVQAVAGTVEGVPGSPVGLRTPAAEPSLTTSTGLGVVPGVQAVAGGGLLGSPVGLRAPAAEPSLTTSTGPGVAPDLQSLAGKGRPGSWVRTRTAAAEPLTTSTGTGPGTRPGRGR
ncbi:hypothetical protein [Streptomyces sp. NPDC058307]|uniref:hypothetical protein n=1 Tax=Streptomyces sp. NPDC058307 TaxID=3346439 RepID=UPI0036E17202